MTVIEIPDDQAAALKEKAAAQGLSLEDWLRKLAEGEAGPQLKPLNAPSAEEIDENRREMFRGFGEEL